MKKKEFIEKVIKIWTGNVKSENRKFLMFNNVEYKIHYKKWKIVEVSFDADIDDEKWDPKEVDKYKMLKSAIKKFMDFTTKFDDDISFNRFNVWYCNYDYKVWWFCASMYNN